jgi:segregation and condensation protein B
VSRARIAGIRGVNVDGVVRTLTTRGLIEEAGTDPESGAVLVRTTGLFLDRLGLASLEELPPMGPLLPDLDALEDEGHR